MEGIAAAEHRAAVEALSVASIRPTPRFVALAITTLDKARENTAPKTEATARSIALDVAKHAGHKACLEALIENERVQAWRIYEPDADMAVSIQDVAVEIIATVFKPIAYAALPDSTP